MHKKSTSAWVNFLGDDYSKKKADLFKKQKGRPSNLTEAPVAQNVNPKFPIENH